MNTKLTSVCLVYLYYGLRVIINIFDMDIHARTNKVLYG